MNVIPTPQRSHRTGGSLPLESIHPTGFSRAAVEQISRFARIDEGGVPIRRVASRAGGASAPTPPGMHPSGDPVDESHRILIGADSIHVEASSDEGAFRAMTTIAHWAATGAIPRGEIEDEPRFGWRGLSLDVARTAIPLVALRGIVEVLASLKLNVLHLHLTDDQGWRLPVSTRPLLAEVGGAMAMAGRAGSAYDEDQYAAFERWARERHVWIVPEIDMPGHVGALLTAYPHLAAGTGVAGEYASRLHLDPDSDEVFELMTEVFTAASRLHGTPYLHIGGDEAFGMDDRDYARIIRRVVDQARLDPTRLIAWQEAVRAGADIQTLQVWRDLDRTGLETDPEIRRRLGLLAAADLETLTARGREDVARIGTEGRNVILSPALVAYLDRPYADEALDDEGLTGVGLPIYRARTVEDSFDFVVDDIVPGLDADTIVGVEAALWTETIPDADAAMKMLLPRLAGLAQRAWELEPEEWGAHAQRLRGLAALWDAQGFTYFRSPAVYGPIVSDDA